MRESGWYWVKYKGEWWCSLWDTDCFWMISYEDSFSEREFEEIGEKIERIKH
jgi:hypothetical protein